METSENLIIVDDQNSGFLSAAELVQIRKSNEEPARSNIGEKFYIRQDNWMESEAVKCALENFTDNLKQNRAARKCDLMQAEWNEELNASITSKLKGKFLQHMGCSYDGKIALSPEESIFLLENGCIEILNEKMPLSTEEAYKIMLKEDLSAEKYQVYSQLSQLGFIVVAHQKGKSKKTMDLSKRQAKRKRRSSTEMYKEPEKKRTSFLGALSNLPDTTVHAEKEGNSEPKTASKIRTVAADSVSQECITVAKTPSHSADNEVPKSSTTHPNVTVSSEKCSIITDPEVPTVVMVENSNHSSVEVNAKVIEEELAPSPFKGVREFVSCDLNESGGHTTLPSAKRTIEGDDPRLSVEGSKKIHLSLSDKTVSEKETSVQSEHSNLDPCCSTSSNQATVGVSVEGSEEINVTINKNDVFSSKEISVQIEDSESCCDTNSNPAPSNFEASLSVYEKGNKEKNNSQESCKDFSSKEISVLIEDSESCNDTNSNLAPSNFKAAVGVAGEGSKEINITLNKGEVFSPKEISVQIEDSESCEFTSNLATSNFKAAVGVSGENSKEVNNTVNNNEVFFPKEISVEIEDSKSCDTNSNPAPLNFKAAVSVSNEGSKEINNVQESDIVFSSKEIPVQIEDSESCNETNSNPAPSNFEATVLVSNNAIDIMNLDSEDTEISCSSESLENNVSNSKNNEDWRIDARHIYEESNSDIMSCSSNDEEEDDDDVLSVDVGDEKLEDDEVELVAVTKKETKPLAVIDLLSDKESESEYSGSDDEIQVVKVCESVRSNDRQNPRSSVIHSPIKFKKEEKPGSTACNSLQVKFPYCARQNMVVVTRPPSMYLPPNVVLSKESYILTFTPCQAQAQRVWNSYRDMQEYQISQRHNQRTEAWDYQFPSRNSRSNFHRSRFESSGGYDSNSWSRNSASDLDRKQSIADPWVNPVRRNLLNSPPGFSNFPNSSPWIDRNPNETQSPELMSSNRRSNSNESMQNPSVSPFNLLPNFSNQFRYPPPNATAINSVVSVSNQDMNVSMVGNHILHPPRPPLLPGYDRDLDGGRRMDLMAAVQRTAYSVASDVLSSMLGSHMNPHMLPPMPPYGAFPPAQNGSHSLGMLPSLNPPFGAQNFGREPLLSNRRREQLRRNQTSNPFPCQYRNVSNRRSWTEVREAVGEQDMELDVGSDVEEVPLNPTDVLWDPEGICPLVKPGTKLPPAEILKKLQVTKMANLRSNTSSNQVYLPNTCSLEITFDVYLPGTNYRKTSPGIPKHRIIVVRSTDPLPKYADIVFLQKKWNDGATLQLAVVDNGDISFQSFNNVCLTVLIPHEM